MGRIRIHFEMPIRQTLSTLNSANSKNQLTRGYGSLFLRSCKSNRGQPGARGGGGVTEFSHALDINTVYLDIREIVLSDVLNSGASVCIERCVTAKETELASQTRDDLRDEVAGPGFGKVSSKTPSESAGSNG